MNPFPVHDSHGLTEPAPRQMGQLTPNLRFRALTIVPAIRTMVDVPKNVTPPTTKTP